MLSLDQAEKESKYIENKLILWCMVIHIKYLYLSMLASPFLRLVLRVRDLILNASKTRLTPVILDEQFQKSNTEISNQFWTKICGMLLLFISLVETYLTRETTFTCLIFSANNCDRCLQLCVVWLHIKKFHVLHVDDT